MIAKRWSKEGILEKLWSKIDKKIHYFLPVAVPDW